MADDKKKDKVMETPRDGPKPPPAKGKGHDAYPIHDACFRQNLEDLQKHLAGKTKADLDAFDNQGNTALHVSAHFGFQEGIQALIAAGATANLKSTAGWTPFDECISSGARNCAEILYKQMNIEIVNKAAARAPEIHATLKNLPDFYMEVEWKFDCLVPLVGNFLPNDTYKMWKKGSSLRTDMSLIGFSNFKATRGHMSFIFAGDEHPQENIRGKTIIVDRDNKTIQDIQKCMGMTTDDTVNEVLKYVLAHDLCSHTTSSETVTFEPETSFFSDKQKIEEIGGHKSKLYKTKGFEFRSFIRSDPHAKKTRIPREIKPAEDMKAFKDKKYPGYFVDTDEVPQGLVWESENLEDKRTQFKGTLWICEDFPILKLTDLIQVMEVMAPGSAHVDSLRNFIELKLPDGGFPIKIEIPVFIAFYATVEFKNFKQCTHDDETLFQIPTDYQEVTTAWTGGEMREMFKTVNNDSSGGKEEKKDKKKDKKEKKDKKDKKKDKS